MTTPDFRERQYVSRFSTDVLGLAVQKNGTPADVDGLAVTVTLINEATGDVVFTRPASRVGVGLYEVQLTSADTDIVGNYRVVWNYTMDTVAEQYTTFIEVGETSPDYDRLEPGFKDIVDGVYFRFADLFDSPFGGPNLQTYFQTHFGRQRLAQLLRVAMGLLNTTAQPFQTFTIDGEAGKRFPIGQWGSLLESALYVEVLKHLVRSYVEQPAFVGGNVTRLDRRDYMDRWQSILADERQALKGQLEVFKIANMGLGKPKVLVSGGVYGRYGPNRLPGSAAARPRYWTRFY